MKEYIAHIKRKDHSDDWELPHDLCEHLIGTSELAARFAENFGEDFARTSGLWHDLGKFRDRFQDYIRLQSGYERENAHIENGQRAPHSTAGAIHAVNTLPTGIGHIFAYLIAGHHAGIPDWYGGRGSLEFRLKDGIAEYKESLEEDVPAEILLRDCPVLPPVAKSVDSIAL
ncbi:MAG: CRISPR-associated endonuclease Cas3'', partial [Gammaproteobacteria bacterium]|nr:CRISPR-associated endonuclease Cas3'' [Gammaproteobacteria bacterium]